MRRLLKNVARIAMRAVALPARTVGLPVPEAVFRHLHFKGPFDIRLPDGGILRLMSWGNRVENEFFWRGWQGHEPETMSWWLSFAAEGEGDILDVGANTGTFAFLAKAMSPGARVAAFEPLARVAARVRENVETSGLDVLVHEMAVADVEGRLQIHDPGGSNAYSASLSADFLPGDKDVYEVEVTTIDAFCAAQGVSPKLIKIDVEGVEGRALLGARETLARTGCAVLCEWLGTDESHARAIALLAELEYCALDTEGLAPVDLAAERAKHARNVILVPSARRDGLRNRFEG